MADSPTKRVRQRRKEQKRREKKARREENKAMEEDPESMAAKYDSVHAMVKSEDYIEGPKAFAEKRPPNWQGR